MKKKLIKIVFTLSVLLTIGSSSFAQDSIYQSSSLIAPPLFAFVVKLFYASIKSSVNNWVVRKIFT